MFKICLGTVSGLLDMLKNMYIQCNFVFSPVYTVCFMGYCLIEIND